jgi:hypothetical protein
VYFARSAFSRLVKASFTASFDTTVEALRKCTSTLGQELRTAAEEGAKLDLYWICPEPYVDYEFFSPYTEQKRRLPKSVLRS